MPCLPGEKCTIPEITAKWNGLRTNYLSECRKYESTQKSGAGADDILKPSLWYFDIMKFIDKYSHPRQSVDIDITAGSRNDVDDKNDEIKDGNDVSIEYIDESEIENRNSNNSCLVPTGPSTSHLSIKSKKNRTSENDSPTPLRPSKKVCREEKIIQEQMLTLSAIRTAIEERKSTVPLSSNSFSNYVAYRLNSITDDDIRAKAEEEITEVLFRNFKIFRNKYHNV